MTPQVSLSGRFDLIAWRRVVKVCEYSCCPALQEVYEKGPSWSNKNVSITFPAIVWMALDFLVVVTLDASSADFVVWILVRSDGTKTHLQPPLMPGTHSLSWHSAADYQYSGPFDMLPVVVDGCGARIGRTLCAS